MKNPVLIKTGGRINFLAETGLSAAFIRIKIMNDAIMAAKMVLIHSSNFLTLLIQSIIFIYYNVKTVKITQVNSAA